MALNSQTPFNPALQDANDEVPAKVWELLRRNEQFRSAAQRLAELDSQARNDFESTGLYHNSASEQARVLVDEHEAPNCFAHIALQWLVPDPLFVLTRRTFQEVGSALEETCAIRAQDLDTPESWPWRDARLFNHTGPPIVRGPEVYWQTSNLSHRCDLQVFLDEWRGWRPGKRLFDCDTSWPDTPAGFRQWFAFFWRQGYDSRPVNPITGNRTDSPERHETFFLRGLNLRALLANRSSGLSRDDLAKIFEAEELGANHRLFAVPKTVRTKSEANVIGKWVAAELKKDLSHDRVMMGTEEEWRELLIEESNRERKESKVTHSYHRIHYMRGLISQIYPEFNLAALVGPPEHRAHGKAYVPKSGNI